MIPLFIERQRRDWACVTIAVILQCRQFWAFICQILMYSLKCEIIWKQSTVIVKNYNNRNNNKTQ